METQNQQGGTQYQQPPYQTIIVMAQNKKSTGVAFILSFFFGPLGLLYASVTGGLIMLVISIPVAIFTLGFGLILTNIICVVWAIIAVNNHNSKASNPQQFQTPQQLFQQPNIVSNPVQTASTVPTHQPITEIKSELIPTQLQQPLQTSQPQQSAFNFGEWFEKNKKTVFIGAGSVVGLLILIVAIKYVMILDFGKSKNNVETTQTAQPTYQESSTPNTQSTNTGKYQQASKRVLTSSDVLSLNKYELKIMRNEIYARYGYIFKTADMKAYFESQSWYSPRYNDVTSFLTETEKRNIELIKRYE